MNSLIIAALIYGNVMTNFMTYKSSYDKAVDNSWADLYPRYILASQIEQESLWNPRAELKTDREYGFGFGQLTIAYKANGDERFNKFTEAKVKFKELSNWAWKDRYNPDMQLTFVVKENKYLFEKFKKSSKDIITNFAFMQASYNGGSGLIVKEIALCEKDTKCDPGYWFCNVAKKSARSTVKYKGYGKSFYDINREYVTNIMFVRYQKYKQFEKR